MVVDTATGLTIRQFDAGGSMVSTDATGSTVTVTRGDGIRELDVQTGAVLRSAPLPLSPGATLWGILGDGHQAGGLFVQGYGPAGQETVLVDPTTLAARQRLPLPADREILRIKVLPDGRTALVSSSSGMLAVVDVIDLASNRVTASTTMFSSWQWAFLMATSAPLAPVALDAAIVGNTVRLSWQLPPASDGASAWVVEAGSRSGAADLAVLNVDGPAPLLTVDAVPPGRYYVRIRAINTNGSSPPSEDLILDVAMGSR